MSDKNKNTPVIALLLLTVTTLYSTIHFGQFVLWPVTMYLWCLCDSSRKESDSLVSWLIGHPYCLQESSIYLWASAKQLSTCPSCWHGGLQVSSFAPTAGVPIHATQYTHIWLSKAMATLLPWQMSAFIWTLLGFPPSALRYLLWHI